jgi:ABC-2 type transport system ATP-binding protein
MERLLTHYYLSQSDSFSFTLFQQPYGKISGLSIGTIHYYEDERLNATASATCLLQKFANHNHTLHPRLHRWHDLDEMLAEATQYHLSSLISPTKIIDVYFVFLQDPLEQQVRFAYVWFPNGQNIDGKLFHEGLMSSLQLLAINEQFFPGFPIQPHFQLTATHKEVLTWKIWTYECFIGFMTLFGFVGRRIVRERKRGGRHLLVSAGMSTALCTFLEYLFAFALFVIGLSLLFLTILLGNSIFGMSYGTPNCRTFLLLSLVGSALVSGAVLVGSVVNHSHGIVVASLLITLYFVNLSTPKLLGGVEHLSLFKHLQFLLPLSDLSRLLDPSLVPLFPEEQQSFSKVSFALHKIGLTLLYLLLTLLYYKIPQLKARFARPKTSDKQSIPKTLLHVSHLKKSFKEKIVVSNVSFSAQAGNIYTVIGENGSGKSTLIKMLAGEVDPDEGLICIAGSTFHPSPSEVSPYISHCTQENQFWEELTVAQHVEIVSILYGIDTLRALRDLSLVALYDMKDIPAVALTTEVKRRLNLYLAGLKRSEIVLLDEPTAGLNHRVQQCIWDYINGLKQHSAVILVTHNLEEVHSLADYVLVMKSGGVLQFNSYDAFVQQGCKQSGLKWKIQEFQDAFTEKFDSSRKPCYILNEPPTEISSGHLWSVESADLSKVYTCRDYHHGDAKSFVERDTRGRDVVLDPLKGSSPICIMFHRNLTFLWKHYLFSLFVLFLFYTAATSKLDHLKIWRKQQHNASEIVQAIKSVDMSPVMLTAGLELEPEDVDAFFELSEGVILDRTINTTLETLVLTRCDRDSFHLTVDAQFPHNPADIFLLSMFEYVSRMKNHNLITENNAAPAFVQALDVSPVLTQYPIPSIQFFSIAYFLVLVLLCGRFILMEKKRGLNFLLRLQGVSSKTFWLGTLLFHLFCLAFMTFGLLWILYAYDAAITWQKAMLFSCAFLSFGIFLIGLSYIFTTFLKQETNYVGSVLTAWYIFTSLGEFHTGGWVYLNPAAIYSRLAHSIFLWEVSFDFTYLPMLILLLYGFTLIYLTITIEESKHSVSVSIIDWMRSWLMLATEDTLNTDSGYPTKKDSISRNFNSIGSTPRNNSLVDFLQQMPYMHLFDRYVNESHCKYRVPMSNVLVAYLNL